MQSGTAPQSVPHAFSPQGTPCAYAEGDRGLLVVVVWLSCTVFDRAWPPVAGGARPCSGVAPARVALYSACRPMNAAASQCQPACWVRMCGPARPCARCASEPKRYSPLACVKLRRTCKGACPAYPPDIHARKHENGKSVHNSPTPTQMYHALDVNHKLRTHKLLHD